MTPIAAVLLLGLAASVSPGPIRQSPPPSTKPVQEAVKPQEAAQAAQPAKPADDDVSVTGCVYNGETSATYILYGAKKDPQDQYEIASTYRLVSSAGVRLEGMVSKSVRVTGMIEKTEATGTKEAELPKLDAKGIKMESQTCADESEETDDSGDSDSDRGGAGGWLGGSGAGYGDGGGYGVMGGSGSSRSTGSLGSNLFGGIGGFGQRGLSSGGVLGLDGSSLGLDATTSLFDTSYAGAGSYGVLAAIDNGGAGGGPAIAVSSTASQLGYSGSISGLAAPESTPAAIPNPEPATLILLGTGLAAAARASRRRRMAA